MTFRAVLTVLSRLGKPADLAATARSLAEQQDSRWEWLVSVPAGTDQAVVSMLESLASADSRLLIRDCEPDESVVETANLGLELAVGEFVLHAEPGTTFDPQLVTNLRRAPESATWLYSDEALPYLSGAGRALWLKPDFSPELLRSCPYPVAAMMVRREAAERHGRLRPGSGEAAWYDLALRLGEESPGVHLAGPYVIRPAAADPDSAPWVESAATDRCRVVAEHCDRVGIGPVEVTPVAVGEREIGQRVRRLPATFPRVSVIIPTRGSSTLVHGFPQSLVSSVVRSLWRDDRYPDLEVVVVYDPDTPQDTLDELMQITGGTAVLQPFAGPFHYSRKCNQGALAASGEILCFLNDDMEIVTPGWLHELVSFLAEPDVGAVGPKLFFADGTLQHVGHQADNGIPGHLLFGAGADTLEQGGAAQLAGERAGVTGACLTLRAADFAEVGGFSELFPLNFNDVDLCLKLRATGRRIVFTPHAQLFHYESQSRQQGITDVELARIKRRWSYTIDHDPYRNPLLEPGAS